MTQPAVVEQFHIQQLRTLSINVQFLVSQLTPIDLWSRNDDDNNDDNDDDNDDSNDDDDDDNDDDNDHNDDDDDNDHNDDDDDSNGDDDDAYPRKAEVH